MSQKVLKVGIIGQGRSGRDIHGSLLAKIGEFYTIVAVADPIPERQTRAILEYGCKAYATWEEMVEVHEELDLVINASYSHQHFPISLELLNKGFNVLCEKPLAKSPGEVDQLIAAAKQAGKILAVFQQSRYNPAFVQIRKVIDSGVLGRIVQIDISYNGFQRRWDWQTLQNFNGGSLMNTGPHPVDQALQLFGSEVLPQVTCIMDRANTYGDAEDYVKLILRGQGAPTIDLEISSCAAFTNDQFNVQGTNGGLHGSGDKLEWKYYKPEEAPMQQLRKDSLYNKEGMPAYCNETLTWYSDNWDLSLPEDRTTFDYMTEKLYRMLHLTLTEGVELEVTPEQVRQQLWVMEECRRQNPQIYKA
jgi:scyllo-inositol 2-dehydrogenase (NADP+)